nr:MAG TPA: hypothetical protein [Caudoviricetes sp.]
MLTLVRFCDNIMLQLILIAKNLYRFRCAFVLTFVRLHDYNT